MPQTIEISLGEYVGIRLDRALATAHSDLSRVQWQRLIKDEQVLIDGKKQRASYKIEGHETAVAQLPEVVESVLLAEDIPLDVIYEDSDLIVVNKRAGMVVHPGTGHESGTLVNALLFHCDDLAGIGDTIRPGIVHRLDMDTSGLMVVAKNDHSLRHLQSQFAERTVHKAYLALCEGQIQPPSALIDAPIGRDPKARKRMAVIPPNHSATSREAQTTYETVTAYDDYTLVRCLLHTGRTHQIRVHMAYIEHPLVGDTVYGRRKQPLLRKRHFLHSAELGFLHPGTNEKLAFKIDLPPELQTVLTEIEQS